MPIDLNSIPDKQASPEPPKILRWTLVIILFTCAGAMFSLYLWPGGMATHSAWFWFCTLVIPFTTGFACYGIRLRIYENSRDSIAYWNNLHQEQYDRLVNTGQRFAGLVGKAYITPIACNKLASALVKFGSQLQSHYFVDFQRVQTVACLGEPLNTSYKSRLSGYLSQLLRMLEPDLLMIPGGDFSVRIHHDGALDNKVIEGIWQGMFPDKYHTNSLIVETECDGLIWLDPWLDHGEARVTLSVEINLFSTPLDYQAESVSALLLASPEWLTQYDIKPEVAIHRPVVSTEDISTTRDMLLWGGLSEKEPYGIWRVQVNQNTLSRVIKQVESMGYSPGKREEYSLDDLFGNPGAATGNISLICASEHAVTSAMPQWIMAENKTMHQLIVRKVDY